MRFRRGSTRKSILIAVLATVALTAVLATVATMLIVSLIQYYV